MQEKLYPIKTKKYFTFPKNSDLIYNKTILDFGFFNLNSKLSSFFNILLGIDLNNDKVVVMKSAYQNGFNSLKPLFNDLNFEFGKIWQRYDLPKINGWYVKTVLNKYEIISGGEDDNDSLAIKKSVSEIKERLYSNLDYRKELVSVNFINRLLRKIFKFEVKLDNCPGPLNNSNALFSKSKEDYVNQKFWLSKNMTKNRFEVLPTSFLFWYNYNDYNHMQISQPTTNGIALHMSQTLSIISSTLEVIERDNFLLHWLCKLPPKLIIQDSLPKDLFNLLNYEQENYNLKYYILYTSYDIQVHSIIFVIEDLISSKISIGGSAGFDLKKTIIKAHSEALISMQHLKESDAKLFFGQENYIPFSEEKINLKIRSIYYNNPKGLLYIKNVLCENNANTKYSIIVNTVPEISNPKSQLNYLKEAFEELSKNDEGYNLYIFSFPGFHFLSRTYSVKAFVPNMIRLWLNENFATPKSKRLEFFYSQKTGRCFDYKNINIHPHPFP